MLPKDMADALGHFCTPGSLAAHFFNRPGKLWPDADVTIFEQDFPDSAKRMLNMMEWWKCLSMPPKEAEQIAHFRELSDEERALLLAAGFFVISARMPNPKP